MARKSDPATLENLPVELKLDIFKRLPDMEDLKALVHASPACHQAYVGARKEIFTFVTLRTLEKRNIDIFKPALCVHVSFRYDARPPKGFAETLRRFWRCMKRGEIGRARLSVGECKALLGLRGKQFSGCFFFLLVRKPQQRLSALTRLVSVLVEFLAGGNVDSDFYSDCIRFYHDTKLDQVADYGEDGQLIWVWKSCPVIRCALPCLEDWSEWVGRHTWVRCSLEACKCCPDRWGSYYGFDSYDIFGGPAYVDLLTLTEGGTVRAMSSWSHGH